MHGSRTGIPAKERNATCFILDLQTIHSALWTIPKLERFLSPIYTVIISLVCRAYGAADQWEARQLF
ncbi:hypothetical protein [Xenorhabdus sp. SGI246]|uniref:hypothetical protein n=1 Tax=Xenorhabdus sp. SGI246 TaxID=3158263 RepID=UPI00349F666A